MAAKFIPVRIALTLLLHVFLCVWFGVGVKLSGNVRTGLMVAGSIIAGLIPFIAMPLGWLNTPLAPLAQWLERWSYEP